jgi:hypothetical protein
VSTRGSEPRRVRYHNWLSSWTKPDPDPSWSDAAMTTVLPLCKCGHSAFAHSYDDGPELNDYREYGCLVEGCDCDCYLPGATP